MHVETLAPDAQPRYGGSPDSLETLLERQRELDARIHQLDAHLYLSADEQVECARLKKLRLATKDRILRLSRTPHGG